MIARFVLILSCCGFVGCSLERIPAAVQKPRVAPLELDLSPCVWHTLPESTTTLLPQVRQIDFEVVGPIVDIEDEIEFTFDVSHGIHRGKQSRKVVGEVNLVTGDHGAIYYINYQQRKGQQESLGMWCGWNNDSEIPTLEELLPNDQGKVHVEPDGGIVYRATWNLDRPHRGLAFVFCGLGGLQHSSKVLGKELLKDGWVVAYVFTVLNSPDYNTGIELDYSEFNTYEYAQLVVDLFDSKYCQVVAATDAIRSRLEEQLPSLIAAPIVLIGISAGALYTPAVYHEMKDEVDCVVLIAGGANMFEIVQHGAMTKWRFTHNMGKPFNRNELLEIESQYLAVESRDPYHIALTLPHDKTLLVHAKWDAIVPAKNGDVLWERAGRPERWVFSGGHLGLLMTFDWYAEDVTDWINSVMK